VTIWLVVMRGLLQDQLDDQHDRETNAAVAMAPMMMKCDALPWVKSRCGFSSFARRRSRQDAATVCQSVGAGGSVMTPF